MLKTVVFQIIQFCISMNFCLNVKTVLFQMIQFIISMQFKQFDLKTINFKQFSLV